ncbi:SGNH/GDSL hydrolase family protein [Janibacter alkaliphilus]|uniref:Lysophospholipase L1-like esterase n=1 Tax=Janibacter alkaliphilus TaxID=1069963 RepID=A0A852WYY7_9MICO|nr:SGNH/GDSL hydrolase family protein [Janibacter alkaliphilus]NYG35819.1 lysophospholipase L1-like esterase [Janibacter alkaliphilus]
MSQLARVAGRAAVGTAASAAAGAALAGLGYGLIQVEGRIARRIVGNPFDGAPDDDGTYGAAPGDPVGLIVLGDSTAAGMGADHRYQTVGAILATGLAAIMGRSVRLTNEAVVGAESADLSAQLSRVLARVDQPDVAVILVGGNDVTHRIDRATSVQHLERTVRYLRTLGIQVVVGTCPDLGTVEPIPFPLSQLLRRWSRDLAAAQTVAAVGAGARTVSMGDLLGPEFAASPKELFSQDRFHPSPAGYARVASALLPSVAASLDAWPDGATGDTEPQASRGEGIGLVSEAADRAVAVAGTEVGPAEVGEGESTPRTRWAMLRRRARSESTDAPAHTPSP